MNNQKPSFNNLPEELKYKIIEYLLYRCPLCHKDHIYFDTQVTLAKKFGLRGIPTSVLFDKNGLEFARIIGSIDFEDEKFIKWLSTFN